MRTISRLALSIALVAVALPAAAQSTTAAPSFNVQVGGGLTVPVFGTRGDIGPGWNVDAGGTIWLFGDIGLRGDYLYSRFASTDATVTLAGVAAGAPTSASINAKEQVHVFSASVSWRHTRSSGEDIYAFAGPSYAHRRVVMKGQAEGLVSNCNRVWLQCEPEPVTFDRAIGIRHANNVGFNLGAGMTFDIGLTTRLFAEARYVYTLGPDFTDTTGQAGRQGVHFLVVTTGLRF